MLEAYSTNVTVTALGNVPFNNVAIEKGCTAVLSSPSTIELNKAGVYMVAVDASATASNTIQLYKDGVAVPQAQSTGSSLSFVSLVQVDKNNCNCNCCTSPVSLRVVATTAGTLTDANICVTKIC